MLQMRVKRIFEDSDLSSWATSAIGRYKVDALASAEMADPIVGTYAECAFQADLL
jgi:hypothetical protein